MTTGRYLVISETWVKNGEQWTVTATNDDGSMRIRRLRRTEEIALPADYVREHVELGYAGTAYRAQGMTVDTTHSMVGATTTSEVLYVEATRGRESNHLYVDVAYDPDPDTSHGETEQVTAEQVLTGVLANRGADISATQTIRAELESTESIPRLAAEYITIANEAERRHWKALLVSSGLSTDGAAEIQRSDAYGPLVAAFRDDEAHGLNLEGTLPLLIEGRTLLGADDVAAVVHGRVSRWIEMAGERRKPGSDRLVAGLIPRTQHVSDPDMARALAERARAINDRCQSPAKKAREPGTHGILESVNTDVNTPPREETISID